MVVCVYIALKSNRDDSYEAYSQRPVLRGRQRGVGRVGKQAACTPAPNTALNPLHSSSVYRGTSSP